MELTIWQLIDQEETAQLSRRIEADPALATSAGESGNLPLHMAVKLDRHQSAALLLKFGVDPNRTTTIRSPISGRIERDICATMLTRSPEMLRRLVAFGASLDAVDGDGRSVFVWLSKTKKPDLLDCFVELGGKTDATEIEKLMQAIVYEFDGVVPSAQSGRSSYSDSAARFYAWLVRRSGSVNRGRQ